MGRRQSRLRKVEESVAELYDEITLPSGSTVAVGPLDRFHALCSLLFEDGQGEQHWLATLLVEQDIDEIPEGSADFVKIVYGMVIPAREGSLETTEEPQA